MSVGPKVNIYQNNTDIESTNSSDGEVISEAETMWQTVEKKQVRMTTRGQEKTNKKSSKQISKIPRKQ